MTSPPTAIAVPRPDGSIRTASQTEVLIRDAHRVLGAAGVEMGPRKVARLVRRFESRVARNGWTFGEFLCNAVLLTAEQRRRALSNPDAAKVISYSDPTGEAAVNRVLRGGGK